MSIVYSRAGTAGLVDVLRSANSPHLVALIHAGMNFPDDETNILYDMHEQVMQIVLKAQEDAAELTSIHNI